MLKLTFFAKLHKSYKPYLFIKGTFRSFATIEL